MSQDMNRSRSAYFYAGLAIFFWSTVPTAFKISLRELGVLPMLTLAVYTSATVLAFVILAGKKVHLLMRSTGKELVYSALLGLVNPFFYYIILLSAYQILPAQVAQPLNMIWPIILVFLSVIVLGQKIGKKSFLALFISFIGVYVISSQGKLFSSGHADIKGVLLATGSSVFWAFYFILNVKDKRDEAIKLFLNFLFASFYLTLTMTFCGKWNFNLTLTGLASSVYVGVFEMGITFLFWLKALQTAETTDKVSNLVYLAPFISLIFVHFIIHEPVYYTTPAGLLLIISGIVVQSRKPSGDK
jgi:drug/metabolite transporter (DMT)-like permease